MPLRVLFAATNEVPEQGELAALKDRFVLKVESRSVQDQFFPELIDAGLRAEAYKGLNQRPWAEGHCTLDDLVKANRYLTFLFAKRGTDPGGDEATDRIRDVAGRPEPPPRTRTEGHHRSWPATRLTLVPADGERSPPAKRPAHARRERAVVGLK